MSENAHNLEQPIQASTSAQTNEDITIIQVALARLHQGCEKHSKELIESRNITNKLKDEYKELKSQRDKLMQNFQQLSETENELRNKLKNEKEKNNQSEEQHSAQLNDIKKQLTEKESEAEKLMQELSIKTNELTELQEAESSQLAELEESLTETKSELAKSKEAQDSLTQKLEEQAKELSRQVKENHDLNLILMERQNQHLAFEKSARRKISELSEDSRTLKEMRKMLGGAQAEPAVKTEQPIAQKPAASNDTTPVKADSATMEDSFEQWLNPPGSKDFNLIDDIAN